MALKLKDDNLDRTDIRHEQRNRFNDYEPRIRTIRDNIRQESRSEERQYAGSRRPYKNY